MPRMAASFCVDEITSSGSAELISPTYNAVSSEITDEYGRISTSVTFLNEATAGASSCSGNSYDFETTTGITLRTTFQIQDTARKNVTPDLSFPGEGSFYLQTENPHWTPAAIEISDDVGLIIAITDRATRSQSSIEAQWPNVSVGRIVNQFRTGCGEYGDVSVNLYYDEAKPVLEVLPGEIVEFVYKGDTYTFANVYSFEDIKINCSDAYGGIYWALWRHP